LSARAIAFDPHDDVAILRVPGLSARPLKMDPDPKSGTSAAILGYPLDGPFDAEPGRLGATQLVSTEDAYGNGPVQRQITSLRGKVRPGNSGGPMVDSAGKVLATVFAAITNGGGKGPGGFAVPNSLVRSQIAAAAARGGRTVGTGHCAG
jgi:S1-C subfamily serine protease